MSQPHLPITAPWIEADTLVERLTKSDDKVEVSLWRTKVRGRLNLRHRAVTVGIDFVDCEFFDEVDLAYCNFEQAVSFHSCAFRSRFNSGDDLDSQTTYAKNVIFHRSRFLSEASFKGARFNGDALFRYTRFEDPGSTARFDGSSFGKGLDFGHAVFLGGVTFKSSRCAQDGLFHGAQFANPDQTVSFSTSRFATLDCEGARFAGGANFNSLTCDVAGLFHGVHFENPRGIIDFTAGSFGKTLECMDTVFASGASFNSLQCGMGAFFHRARFESRTGDVDFTGASLGKTLNANHAVFFGAVEVSAVRAEVIAVFQNVQFRNPEAAVRFKGSSFGLVNCMKTFFGSRVDFSGLRCEEAFFQEARFEGMTGQVLFEYARFGRRLDFVGTVFQKPVSFVGMQVEGKALLRRTRFENPDSKVDARLCKFSIDLVCEDTRFGGPLIFESSSVSGTLRATRSVLDGKASFRNSSLKRLELAETLFAPDSLDLRGCTFQSFEGDYRQLLEKQEPKAFSRDPFLQIEKYYAGTGDEAQAREIFYKGRCALHEAAKRRETTGIEWSPWKRRGDGLLKWLVGYGVRSERLLAPFLLFLLLGTFVFWSNKALALPPGKATPPSASLPTDSADRLVHRLGYSLDLFLPIVDLQFVGDWRPRPLWSQDYAIVHIAVGWLLVPLLVASLSGILRKQ